MARVRLLGRYAVRIDEETTWSRYEGAIADLRWRLRHAPESVTKSDMLVAAEALSCYAALVTCPTKKRQLVVGALRAAEAIPEASDSPSGGEKT
jgi:hypothetical protein